MTFIVKFLTKGILVIALEVSEIISDAAAHLISPSRIGYRMASHLDLYDPKDDDAWSFDGAHLLRPRNVDRILVVKNNLVKV